MLSPVFLSSLRVGVDTLRANLLRTLLSTLGIIMGVGALVSVLSLGDGVEHYARRQIERTTDLQVINITAQRFHQIDGVPVANTDVPSFTVADVDSLRHAVGTSNEVTLYTAGATLVRTRADTTPRGVQVVGGTAGVQAMRGLTIEKGRFYTETEGRGNVPVIVLSRPAANALVRPVTRDGASTRRIPPPAGELTTAAAALLGDTLYVRGRPCVVVGILRGDAEERQRLIYMPLGAAAELAVESFGARAA